MVRQNRKKEESSKEKKSKEKKETRSVENSRGLFEGDERQLHDSTVDQIL